MNFLSNSDKVKLFLTASMRTAMTDNLQKHQIQGLSLRDVPQLGALLNTLMSTIRETQISPEYVKAAPFFTSAELTKMCGLDRQRFHYLLQKGELPGGTVQGKGRSRVFTLEEAQTWMKARPDFTPRPTEAKGVVISVSNLKGGSAKTSTTMCIAQGLTLLGRKVLMVDLDPQGSLTEFSGLLNENELTELDSYFSYLKDPLNHPVEGLVQKSYWKNLDVIPANPALFGAEYMIPALMMENPDYLFFNLLNESIDSLRDEYDYILFDTSPSLSYLTFNAIFAADAIVMPVLLDALDVISSFHFWKLLEDFVYPLEEQYGIHKEYDLVSILPSKTENTQTVSKQLITKWLNIAYPRWLSSVHIPRSTVMQNTAAFGQTPFDLQRGDVDQKSLNRILEPWQDYIKTLDLFFVDKWKQRHE